MEKKINQEREKVLDLLVKEHEEKETGRKNYEERMKPGVTLFAMIRCPYCKTGYQHRLLKTVYGATKGDGVKGKVK